MLMHTVLYVIYVCIIIFIQKVISSNKIKVTIIPYIHQKNYFLQAEKNFLYSSKKKNSSNEKSLLYRLKN